MKTKHPPPNGERPTRQGEPPDKSNAARRSDTPLPAFLQDLIGCPPRHGSGVHQWLYRVARHLHAHRDRETIIDLLAAACDGCGRPVPMSEIVAAVDAAKDTAWQPNGTRAPMAKPAPKWPVCNQAARETAIESSGVCAVDLWEASPISCTRDSTDAEFFADQLFPGNPLLCIGKDMATFRTAPREDFRGSLHDLALVVPSPMSALSGRRKSDGKTSAHTLENTGPRKYLITEFDSGTADEQAALIWHLRQFAPLVLVVSSGGKSLHAWWTCRGISEDTAKRFMRYAASIGADPATWLRSQFVRLPQGHRHDKGATQEVLFFDHTKLESEAAHV